MFASGAVVWLILGGMAAEAVLLTALHHRTGRGLGPRDLLPNLAAGGFLVGATGAVLGGAPWGWVAALLLAGGVLHVIDLRSRWR